jgi:sugar phosphate isomerase/epimerase
MPQLKVAIHLPSLRQPFKQALLTAAQLGASAVEIDARNDVRPGDFSGTGVRQLRKMLDDLNLRVAAVSFITRRGYTDEQDLSRRVEATKEAMKFAYDLGASVVVNYIGQIPRSTAEAPDPRWDILVEVLRELGAHGHRVGAWLAARTGGESADDLARLVRALPDGSLGIDLDPGGLLMNGFSPTDVIAQLGSSIIHVHARDGVRDLGRGRGAEVPLGRGEAEFPVLAAMLEQQRYRGYYTLQRQGDNAVAEIGQGVRYLKSL